MEYAPSLHLPESTDAERDIIDLERRNGIYTSADRLLAASLVIEPTFLYPAVIAGQGDTVAYAFGKERWFNYLTARALTTWNQNTPLGRHDILYAYILTNNQPNHIDSAGYVIPDADIAAGNLHIGSSDARGWPTTCTPEQISTINRNPYTEWLPVTYVDAICADLPASDHPLAPAMQKHLNWAITASPSSQGYINYLCKSRAEKMRGLLDCVKRYNANTAVSPLGRAVMLERDIVSVHAGRDCNGTVANLFMNLSLLHDGQGPTLPFPDDLTASFATHLAYARQGQAIYQACQNRVKDGCTDPIELFGLAKAHEQYLKSPLRIPELNGKIRSRHIFEQICRHLGLISLIPGLW